VLRSYLVGREGRQDMVAFGLLATDPRPPREETRT